MFIIPEKPEEKIDRTLLEMDNWGGPWPENTQIANNILYIENQADISWGESTHHSMTSNMISGKLDNMIDRDKNLFDNPGWQNLKDVTDQKVSLKNLQLKPESPCIDKGVSMAEQVIRDFFGNEVKPGEQPDIRIHEYNSK